MKKFLLLILLAGFTLTNCSDDKDGNPLVGTWSLDHVDVTFKLNGVNKSLHQEALTNEEAAALLTSLHAPAPGSLGIVFTENTATVTGEPAVNYAVENGIIYFINGTMRAAIFKYKFEGGFLVLNQAESMEITDPEYIEVKTRLEEIFGTVVSNIEAPMYFKKV